MGDASLPVRLQADTDLKLQKGQEKAYAQGATGALMVHHANFPLPSAHPPPSNNLTHPVDAERCLV